jgi:L-2-hydroxyglutarate oxidase
LDKYDYIIIGAGIVGLATAINLLKINPNLKLLILEKEKELAKHQTGNNSGVIHSGIYYKPGSLKAVNCSKGYKLLLEYCEENEIEYELCGKLIIADGPDEELRLEDIYNRGKENGLTNLKIINKDQIREFEPNASGTKAIIVPQTGIIDFKKVLFKFSETLKNYGCEIFLENEVVGLKEKSDEIEVETKNCFYSGKFVISCAGLQSDRLAKLTNSNLDIRIIPFRGEYFKLSNKKKKLVRNLIYPVPDPSFPFLGVHFTRKIDGNVEAGPNAVLAFNREGYNKLSFSAKDSIDTFTWPGFHKMALKYWRTGISEFYRSYNKNSFAKSLKKLVPEINAGDLEKGCAGIRAQACDLNGNLLDDFNFQKSKRILHVCNAPSPAATSSLAIGESIAGMFYN